MKPSFSKAGTSMHPPTTPSTPPAQRAELHFVHATASGKERAVLAFMIDPVPYGTVANSTFFESFPLTSIPSYHDHTTKVPLTLDLKQALTEVNNVKNYWAYEGSLTSPPCTEGMRWFVAGTKMNVGTEQMQELLANTTYGAREEQKIWGQKVNV